MPFSSFFLLVYFVAPIGEPAVHFFFCGWEGFCWLSPFSCCDAFRLESKARWCYIDPLYVDAQISEPATPKKKWVLYSVTETQTPTSPKSKNTPPVSLGFFSQCRRCLHTVYIAFLLSLFSFFTRYSYTYVLYTLSLVCLCGKGSEREPTSQPHIDRSTSSGCCHPCCCHPNGEIETIYHHHHLPCYAINIFFACQANRIAKRNKRSERIGDR